MKYILGPMRLPFVILPVACVLLGLGSAIWTTGEVNMVYFFLALIGGISAHISVNAINEYFDFKSGLDSRTSRTPFSGGSGTLQEKPEYGRTTLITSIITLVIPGLIGLYFLYIWGWGLLPLGLIGLLVVVAYTPFLAHIPLLSLVAPGLGFGTLMVMGTDFVLTGQYTPTSFTASLVPFFLVNDLLLLNQFPDTEADESVGRKNYPIVIGRQSSSLIFIAFLVLAYLSIMLGVFTGMLPLSALLGLLTLIVAVPLGIGAYRHAENIEKLIPYLGMNVLVNVFTPALVALGFFVG